MANHIQGEVSSIDEAGSLITNIANENVAGAPQDDTVVVKFGGHETLGIHPTDHEQPAATMVASRGNSGFVEIEIVGISLAEMLGIGVGEAVEVIWT